MEPTPYPATTADAEWSKWVESVRKDVECFFGIVKERFRLLKLPIIFRKKEDIDNIFFTCCTLHNMLHQFDGMDQLEEGVQWTGEDGLHEPEVAEPTIDVSSMRTRQPVGNDEADEVELSHNELKQQLIESYTHRKAANTIRWIRR